jgi:hypothetical protein
MDRVLRGLEHFTASYIDDLTMFSNSWDEHLSHVALVLNRLTSAGFTLRPKKCHIGIGVREVEFLGYIADANGHRPSPANTAAITSMAFPEHPDAMRSWIRLVNVYCNCIPRCAILLESPQDRVHQRRTGLPTDVELAAFHALRDALFNPDGPVLARPDFDKDFYISQSTPHPLLGLAQCCGSCGTGRRCRFSGGAAASRTRSSTSSRSSKSASAWL